MPKPHGTFIHVKQRQKINHTARLTSASNPLFKNKKASSLKGDALDMEKAFKWLLQWQDDIKKGVPRSKEDKIRENLRKLIEQVEEQCTKSIEFKELYTSITLPREDSLMPLHRDAPTADLGAQIILLLKILQVAIVVVGRKRNQ